MPLLPSQIALLGSLTAYPSLLRLFSGPSPSPTRFSKSIKAISTLHSSLITLLALYALNSPPWTTSPVLPPRPSPPPPNSTRYPDDTHNPLISTKSELANAITAIETGFLIQDTFALLLHARLHGGPRHLDKTLLTHHVLIGSALLVLHGYIARGREAGVYVIVMFLLMNASTPILNLRWYLRGFARERRWAVGAADVAFVGGFFAARVWLVGRILGSYGAWHGWGAWRAFWFGLRVPCQIGTGALWVANVGWWVVLVGNLVGRSRGFSLGGQ